MGRGLPLALRAFLLTLAVVDDLGAIIVIAIFYSHGFQLGYLVASVALVAPVVVPAASALQRQAAALAVYLPARPADLVPHPRVGDPRDGRRRGHRTGSPGCRHDPGEDQSPGRPGRARPAPVRRPGSPSRCSRSSQRGRDRPRRRGLHRAGRVLRRDPTSPVAIGVLVGLLVGKPIGVFGGAWLMARFTRASLNPALRWADVIAVGVLAGHRVHASPADRRARLRGGPPAADRRQGRDPGRHLGAAVLSALVLAASQARPGPDRGRGGRRLRRRRDPRRLRAREVGRSGPRSRRPRRQGRPAIALRRLPRKDCGWTATPTPASAPW